MEYVPDYYNKKGRIISSNRWHKLINDKNYRTIYQTQINNGIEILTLWTGVDHTYDGDTPRIFESYVFKPTSSDII